MLYTFGGKAPQVDPTAFVSASAELIGDVIVGPRCYIGPFAVIRADASRIVLEEEVAVEDGVIIHTGGEDPVVTISRRVTIGHGAIIHARVIGPEASIGMGAVLSLCSEIGAGSIVAESALVPQGKSVPPETLVAGIPAKPLRPLTQADLNKDTPYNLRMHEGLPPTPICSPSLEALKATLEPTDSDDLYFYITQDEEYFSQTYEEHQQSWN